jgi:hypothetical protein
MNFWCCREHKYVCSRRVLVKIFEVLLSYC